MLLRLCADGSGASYAGGAIGVSGVSDEVCEMSIVAAENMGELKRYETKL